MKLICRFQSRQVERETMWSHFPIFKANPNVRTLSGRKDPMLTGSLASSSSSSMLLHSRGLQQEDYVHDNKMITPRRTSLYECQYGLLIHDPTLLFSLSFEVMQCSLQIFRVISVHLDPHRGLGLLPG